MRKTKIPLWERAQSSHSASGTPDAISGQSGKLRQDAATMMKYSCLPTGNLECFSAVRPELSGKAALFPRHDRPYGLKRNAFQTEQAPETEKGGLHPSGHGPPRLEGTGKAADQACSCKTLSGRLEHSFTPHHAFAGNIFFTPTRRRRPRYARSGSRPGQSDARRAFPCTVRVPPRKCP